MYRTMICLCGVALILGSTRPLQSAEPDRRQAEHAADPQRTKPGPYRALPLRVVKLDEKSITVYPRVNAKVEEVTFHIDPKVTKVFTHEVVDQRTDDQGRVVYKSKVVVGSLDDVEVGRDVYIGSNDDEVAVDIIVAPAPPKRDVDKGEKAKNPPRDGK
jgi:hypothetical protein